MDSRVFYARNTTIERLDLDEAQTFVEVHHRSGSTKGKYKIISLGLFYEDELLAVAQFTGPRTSAARREYSTELLRLAFKRAVRVIGGASKLVAHYRTKHFPADIFTYQDMTGRASDVYERCGFTLVRQERDKQYLVAPGKTLETASRKEALGMAYATQYGPGRTIGSKLGEVFRQDGSRKSNRDIFVEDLGWHVETTDGDRVYEWINPNLTFYTYKITAKGSSKYYYGVSHVKRAHASVEECLTDGYFGSGGPKNGTNKFNNWKKKYSAVLVKEVISIHTRQAQAYEAEKKLIGDLWKTDANCLNSITGGKAAGLSFRGARRTKKNCSIHGSVLHQGDSCLTCSSLKRFSVRLCPVHGGTRHTGANCLKCLQQKRYTEGVCETHGAVTLYSGVCRQCENGSRVMMKTCPVHGESKHTGSTCFRCINSGIAEKECPTHGLSKHRGEHCMRCISESVFSKKTCTIHGPSTHRGDSCDLCVSEKVNQRRVCAVHGLTKFQGETCSKCSSAKLYSLRTCAIHGEVKHRKNVCLRCQAASKVALKECSVHGLVKHQAGRCCSCVSELATHTRDHSTIPKESCRLCYVTSE